MPDGYIIYVLWDFLLTLLILFVTFYFLLRCNNIFDTFICNTQTEISSIWNGMQTFALFILQTWTAAEGKKFSSVMLSKL